MKRNFISKTSRTDWKYIDTINDEDIDFYDNPEVGAEMFERAVVRKRLKPVAINLSNLIVSEETAPSPIAVGCA